MIKNATLFVVLLLLLAVTWPAMGQDDANQVNAMGGGGPYVGWLSLNLADLNANLVQNDYAPFPEGMLVFGGNGFGGMLEGVRFGGGGASGDVTTQNAEKVAKLEVGYGGFLISWGLAHGDNYDVALGAIIGGGEAQLKLIAHRPNSFEEAVVTPANTLLTRNFFVLQPQASIGFSLTPWLAVRVAGSYLFSITDAWRQESVQLPGPPASFRGWEVHIEFGVGGTDYGLDA